jgi:hypothetical protein
MTLRRYVIRRLTFGQNALRRYLSASDVSLNFWMRFPVSTSAV